MNPVSIPPALVAFVDERLEYPPGLTRIIAGCCVFARKRWMAFHQKAASVGGVGSRRRLPAIHDFLNTMGGIAVLVFADIPSDLCARGETDRTDDIPRMARTDNLWAQVVLSVVTSAVARIHSSGVPLGSIDLYFDRKDLKAAHRIQFENIIRQTIPEISMQSAVEYPQIFTPSPYEFRFDTIEAINKPDCWSAFNAFQQGTHLAHHLCSQAGTIIHDGSAGRILVRNHTDVVRGMLTKLLQSLNDDLETPASQAEPNLG